MCRLYHCKYILKLSFTKRKHFQWDGWVKSRVFSHDRNATAVAHLEMLPPKSIKYRWNMFSVNFNLTNQNRVFGLGCTIWSLFFSNPHIVCSLPPPLREADIEAPETVLIKILITKKILISWKELWQFSLAYQLTVSWRE